MELVLSFVVAAVFSFWGSILLGVVNTAVIQEAINSTRKNATFVAIGGVLPEIPYSLIPLFFSKYIDSAIEYKTQLGMGIGIVLVIYGLSILYKHNKKKKSETLHILDHTKRPFFKGLILGFLNPQLIFFWSGIILLIKTGTFNLFGGNMVNLDDVSTRLIFSLGACLGALGILLIYIKLASRYKENLQNLIGANLSKMVGWFFILFGLFAALKNVF